MSLQCGHDHEARESLAHCNRCNRYLPMREANPHYNDYMFTPHSYVYHDETYWDVTFSCGHKDRVYTVYQGSWCFSCKGWEIYTCKQKAKEKEMSWNGKKFWKIYSVGESEVSPSRYISLDEANQVAESLAQQHNSVYLVLETVSGFSPKKQTERVKFEK